MTIVATETNDSRSERNDDSRGVKFFFVSMFREMDDDDEE